MSEAREQVSILFGGRSPEYVASVESTRNVLNEIESDERLDNFGFKIDKLYFIDRDNRAYISSYQKGSPVEIYMTGDNTCSYALALEDMRISNNFIFNILIGRYGEDGHIQGAANLLDLRGTFGPPLPAALAMSKLHMNGFAAAQYPELFVPATICVYEDQWRQSPAEILAQISFDDYIIKPNSLGASIGVSRHRKGQSDEQQLIKVFTDVFEFDTVALVQEFIAGDEYSVGCVRTIDGIEALPVVQITTQGDFFGHAEKHKAGLAVETVITTDNDITSMIKKFSSRLFHDCEFQDICRFDYIVSHKKIYFLEVNPVPGMMKNSIFPKMLKSTGKSFAWMLDQMIMNCKQRDKKRFYLDYIIE